MTDETVTSTSAFLGRITWMMLGPMVLVLAAVAILKNADGWFAPLDAAYFAVLGLILLGRWAEYSSGGAKTANGEPATPAQYRNYMVATPMLGLAGWVIANLIGNSSPLG